MPYHHLTLEERSMIAPMRFLGLSLRHIAAQLGRAPSTISRELRRNGDGTGAYAGYWAHRDAQRRCRLAARRSCLTSGVLAVYVRGENKGSGVFASKNHAHTHHVLQTSIGFPARFKQWLIMAGWTSA
jgi:IS30 family transposase